MSGRARGRAGVGLEEVDRLFVDGNNLLHRRGAGPTGAAPRLLLASMRAALPPTLEAVLMLDGQPDPGAPHREVVGRGLEVRYAGRVDADSVLVELVAARPFAERARTLVVTDDRGLVERVRRVGGRTERLDWFERLLAGVAAGGRGARPGSTPDVEPDDADARPPWQPGRGATRKRGNPKRGRSPKSS